MTEKTSIKFKYDIVSALVYGLFLGIILVTVLNKTSTTIDLQDHKSLFFVDILAGLSSIYFIYKILIPALFGKIALELTNEDIIDHMNNRVIKWSNVKNTRKITFSALSTGIAIELFDKTQFTDQLNSIQKPFFYITDIFYGTPLIMAFQYISGDNSEILQAMQNCFHSKNNS